MYILVNIFVFSSGGFFALCLSVQYVLLNIFVFVFRRDLVIRFEGIYVLILFPFCCVEYFWFVFGMN